jgi:hypothetical protein
MLTNLLAKFAKQFPPTFFPKQTTTINKLELKLGMANPST